MELQINDLISTIKKDGIEVAEQEAEKIIAEAKTKAEEIIADAEREADGIVKKAHKETELMRESVRTGAEHAKRDATLAFKEAVKEELHGILSAKTADAMNGATLSKLIIAAINDENPADYIAEVAEITEELKSELSEKIKAGLEIKLGKNIRTGFVLSLKDGSGYFDCSDEQASEMLAPFFPELSI